MVTNDERRVDGTIDRPKPLLLLDFDGVINCFPEDKIWRRGKQDRLVERLGAGDPRTELYDPVKTAFLIDKKYKINLGKGDRFNLRWSSELVDDIRRLQEDVHADLMWLSSWMLYTDRLNALLGLIGERYGDPSYLDDEEYNVKIQIRTAQWFDPVTRMNYSIGKRIYVENLLKDMVKTGEKRPLIWCDDEEADELNERHIRKAGLNKIVPILMIQPDERIGISRSQFSKIKSFIEDYENDSLENKVYSDRTPYKDPRLSSSHTGL